MMNGGPQMTLYTIEEMRELKMRYGISYTDLHEHCSLALSTIQKSLGGFNKHPRRETLEELSKAFHALIPPPADTTNRQPDSFTNTLLAETINYHSRGSSALEDHTSGSEIYTQRGYTYADYLKLDLPPGSRIEIIDGVIYDMSAPTLTHQDITGFFYSAFSNFISQNKGKCRAYVSPVDVRLEYRKANDIPDDMSDMTIVQPDMLVICDKDKLSDKKAVRGAPDFVLEVVSPSSRRKDTNLKLKKYRACGVREYWIVDYDSGIVIKNVFSPEERTSMHTFEDTVPVEIYNGKLSIDLNALQNFVNE